MGHLIVGGSVYSCNSSWDTRYICMLFFITWYMTIHLHSQNYDELCQSAFIMSQKWHLLAFLPTGKMCANFPFIFGPRVFSQPRMGSVIYGRIITRNIFHSRHSKYFWLAAFNHWTSDRIYFKRLFRKLPGWVHITRIRFF